jgi:hypothetical protein
MNNFMYMALNPDIPVICMVVNGLTAVQYVRRHGIERAI